MGWAIFDPKGTTSQTILGLRSLMFIFPVVFILIGVVVMFFYPISAERADELRKEVMKRHNEKKQRVSEILKPKTA